MMIFVKLQNANLENLEFEEGLKFSQTMRRIFFKQPSDKGIQSGYKNVSGTPECIPKNLTRRSSQRIILPRPLGLDDMSRFGKSPRIFKMFDSDSIVSPGFYNKGEIHQQVYFKFHPPSANGNSDMNLDEEPLRRNSILISERCLVIPKPIVQRATPQVSHFPT